MCDRDSRNYSGDATNLGHARGDSYRDAMAAIYTACHTVLRPGGLLVTVTKTCATAAGSSTSLPPPAASSKTQDSVTYNMSSHCTSGSAAAGSSRGRRSGSCTAEFLQMLGLASATDAADVIGTHGRVARSAESS